MFLKFDSTIKACIKYLRLLNVKVNDSTVNETLQNHPDWPSLLSISDSLHKWNVANGAGKIDPKEIDRLPTPFIAYTRENQSPLVVVKEINGNEVVLFRNNYSLEEKLSIDKFREKWDGIYLISEPDQSSGEANYDINRKKSIQGQLIPILTTAVISGLYFFLLINKINASTTGYLFDGYFVSSLIFFTGTIVTIMLLWYEIDSNNPLLQKVCTGITKGNCSAILTGKHSKLFSWLSWSEIGFFYFTGGLLTLLIIGSEALQLIALLNLLAFPYILFSIYYQWRVAKQWCILCLAVQGILLAGVINILLNEVFLQIVFPKPGLILTAFFMYTIPILIWFTVKPHLLQLQESKTTRREFLRLKFNTEIFESLLQRQKKLSIPSEGLGIEIGNIHATNILIKVCNPYCGPCSKAHVKIEELLQRIDNLKVRIIFTTPNDLTQEGYKPVSHLLAINETESKQTLVKALDDWYLAEVKDYSAFSLKHALSSDLASQSEKVEAMYQWCKTVGIEFTPTFFINGYQLPNTYSIEELEYFLLD